MKTVTVRDLRQRWPETEKALATEGEITVTRDGKPVARILPYIEPIATKKKVKRFDFDAHMRWLKQIAKDDPPGMRSSDEILHEMRNKGHLPVPPVK